MFPPGDTRARAPSHPPPTLSLKATVANVLTTTDYLGRRGNNKKPFVSPSVTDSFVGHWGWGWGRQASNKCFLSKASGSVMGRIAPSVCSRPGALLGLRFHLICMSSKSAHELGIKYGDSEYSSQECETSVLLHTGVYTRALPRVEVHL